MPKVKYSNKPIAKVTRCYKDDNGVLHIEMRPLMPMRKWRILMDRFSDLFARVFS